MKTSDDDENPPYAPHVLAAAKMFLEPLLPIIEVTLDSIEKAEESDNALTSPRTYLHNMERDLAAAANRANIHLDDPNKYLEAFFVFFRDVLILRLPESMRRMTRASQAKTDAFLAAYSNSPQYQSFDALTRAANAISPDECNKVFQQFDLDSTDRKLQLAYSLLHHAQSCEGELLAEYAIHAAKRTSEILYQPYVRTLHWLFRLSNNNNNNANLSKMKYGAVHNEMVTTSFLTNYPLLLDVDAVLIRNAEAHESWDYFPDSQEIEVSDKGIAPKRLSVTELLRRTEEMLDLSGIMLPGYIRMRNSANLQKLSAIVDKIEDLLPDLAGKDRDKRKSAFQILEQRISNMKE